jgi:serine phosphatase RsbU (regulator of sigma subunit)
LHKNFFLPLDESLSALLMSLEEWNGTGEYEDDITILAIEMEG